MKEVDKFVRYLKKKDLSANTIKVYSLAVEKYFQHYDVLNKQNLEEFREWMIGHYSPQTVNARISALNCYLECVGVGSMQWRMKFVKIQNKLFNDNIITKKEYDYFKECLNNPEERIWYLIVWFLAATGVRISELLQFRIENLIPGFADVVGKGSKVRRVYIPEQLREEALRWYHSENRYSGYCFCGEDGLPLDRTSVHRTLKAKAVKYGINPEVVYPHSFRHFYAKSFLESNSDIALLADILGHSSIETTRLYLRKSSAEMKDMVNQVVSW